MTTNTRTTTKKYQDKDTTNNKNKNDNKEISRQGQDKLEEALDSLSSFLSFSRFFFKGHVGVFVRGFANRKKRRNLFDKRYVKKYLVTFAMPCASGLREFRFVVVDSTSFPSSSLYSFIYSFTGIGMLGVLFSS